MEKCGSVGLKAARVAVCDGKPLVYDRARIHNERGVFAGNGRLHDVVLEKISGVW